MDNNEIQLVGGPCGQHGPYTFYKAFKYTKNGIKRIVTLSEFFFVKLWIDSDLLCIGELQLLWNDKNSDQVLASLRLYFLPENTPEGRMDHGEDEVLAIAEKVVLRVEDLITWITVNAEWTWGRLAKCEDEVKDPTDSDAEDNKNIISSLTESSLDFSDVEKERKASECTTDQEGPLVIILSYPRYCRYRAMMRRLEGLEDEFLKYKIVKALGGFSTCSKNTRVLFCKDTFDYPELEGHELLCNHLAPKLKGRPRGKRKKRSISPGSESNESESSVSNVFNSSTEKITSEGGLNGIRCDSSNLRRSTRAAENNESKQFLKELSVFMKSNYTPIGRIPSLGYKELDLHSFYVRVQKLGGYDAVTTNRLWKSIFDDMIGHQNSTSATTVIRRHYERFLLPYERHMKGEEDKPLPLYERRRLKSKTGSSASDAETSESTSRSGNSTPVPQSSNQVSPVTPPTPVEIKEFSMQVKSEGKTSSLRSVRVKPERQKDKQQSSDKLCIQNNNNNDINPLPAKSEEISETSMEERVPKTEYNDEEQEPTTVVLQSASVSSEPIPVVPVKIEIATSLTATVTPPPTPPPLILPPPTPPPPPPPPLPPPPHVVPHEKNVEPLTSAVAPVAQKLSPELPSMVEGKENIPIIKTGDTPSPNISSNNKITDIIEVPYKPKSHLQHIIDLEASEDLEVTSIVAEKKSPPFMPEFKKRKLEILKEGGLEVTPVRNFIPPSPLSTDVRPSVIQQAGPQVISKKSEIMPPPSINTLPAKRLQISTPQATSVSQVPPKPPVSSYVKGTVPPKVVQSKSIYTYSEKTVYGNPKEYMLPPDNPVHTPKFVGPRSTGGDVLDLTINSPQKPAVEIVKVPNYSHPYVSPLNLAEKSVYKIYKPTNAPVIDGRRLGSNLEITLVGPNKSNLLHHHHQPKYIPPPTSPQPNFPHHRGYPQKRQPPIEHYNQKIPRIDENGRHIMKPAITVPPISPIIREAKHNVEISIPHPFANRNSNTKPEHMQLKQPPPQHHITPTTLSSKHLQNPPPFSYLSQFYESSKGMPSYMPLLDPIYYSAAMQNLYSHSPMNATPPILSVHTTEQLKLYTEYMAHSSRLNIPFHIPPSGNSSINNNNNNINNNNNNFKKP